MAGSGTGTGTPVIGTSSAGGLVVAPAVEPVSIQDMKEHLLLDSGSFSDNLTTSQSIVPGDHVVAAAYSLVGASVDVLGFSAVVNLNSGTNGATGTVDVKIQDSNDNVTFTDWTGGAFTQVTTANDNALQEIEYTGSRQYIRVLATVLLATCDFSVDIVKYASDITQDTLLTTLIVAARQRVEAVTQRKLITQTWNLYLDRFPKDNSFIVPYGNLQSVSSLKYTDSDGDDTTMTVTTDYLVDSSNDPGRIVLPYGVSWPSFTPYPYNPITLQYVCGYGNAASNVPAGIKTSIKMLVEDTFNSRDAVHQLMSGGDVIENKTVMAILWQFRMWLEM